MIVSCIGNTKLLQSDKLVLVHELAPPQSSDLAANLNELERRIEKAVLDGGVIVLDFNKLSQDEVMRAGVVPLRWGAPRVLILKHGRLAQGVREGQEIFRSWRLWRYRWDGTTDLALVTRRSLSLQQIAQVQPRDY